MNRREALKGIGLSVGYIAATPAVLSMLQSCKTESPGVAWEPKFFSKDEAIIVENLVNLILPKTDKLPGAADVNVTQFLDLYVSKAANTEDQEQAKQGIGAVMKALGKSAGKLTSTDYETILMKYLKASPEQMEAFNKDEGEAAVLNTLMAIRGQSIWAYKSSELIGEKYLKYDPVPGVQKGCISLEEATGGVAWSL